MRIALVSLDQRWEDKPANLERSRALAGRAAERGADLVVFPELTLTGFTMNAELACEPADDAPTIRAFAALAREHGVNIAFGVALHGRTRPTNSIVVVDRAGTELARYAKAHPFSLAREDDSYEAGDALATAAIDGVACGLTICYDLRFPEIYRALAPRCAVLLVIANWPATRIAHWHALLRARAIENQCFVVGVNRTGSDANGLDYPASSVVLDPMGEPVAADRAEAELDIVGIEPAVVERLRQRLPFLADRRAERYAAWLRAVTADA